MENQKCIFCEIARGNIPSNKIYEDKNFLGVMDAFPVMKGQTLLITKQHLSPYIFDLEDSIYKDMMFLAKKLAKKMDRTLKPIKTGMIIEGLEVQHPHLKLLPLTTPEGFGLKPMKPNPTFFELNKMATEISK
jgi:histidine triad (HIT) family protein